MNQRLGILGRKIGMTQVFKEDGSAIPITVVEAGPCWVIQKKTREKDGYEAIQLGFLPKSEKRLNKPLSGHIKKAEVGGVTYIRELRVKDTSEFELGQEIRVDLFKAGDYVDVTGFSKGRGFAGVMKRHGFHGAPGSHGTHEYFRHGGSVGSATYPHHVFKGKKMPGHYGNSRVTIQNLQVFEVREDQNLILLKGGVPGARNGLLVIQEAKKKGSSKKALD
ncbi:MAG: 50S ribosomal protein L3 [Thermodesulfobacteriota bacterium]